MDKKLITALGEDDYSICKETTVPYIGDADEEAPSYQALELVSVIRNLSEPRPNTIDHMVGKVLLRNGFTIGS